MQDRLSKLVGIFEGIDFRANRAHGDDLLGDEYEYRRFEYGEPPAKNGDLAFLLHLLASLYSTGKGAIIMPHGVLFRGNREADIRGNLVRRGLIKGVIGLPANLFYGTGIPACIVVIDKENAVVRRSIFMIDASKGFQKDGAKNRLRDAIFTGSWMSSTSRGRRPDTLAWCRWPRSPARPTTTTSTFRDTSTRVSARTCMTWGRICMVTSRTATSTSLCAYWEVFPGLLKRPAGFARRRRTNSDTRGPLPQAQIIARLRGDSSSAGLTTPPWCPQPTLSPPFLRDRGR